MDRKIWLCLSTVAFVSCLALGCRTVEVHRAALVQPPTLPSWSGKVQPHGVNAGSSTVLWQRAPEKAAGSTSGLYVSSVQADGTIHFSLGNSGQFALWLPFSYGLSEYSFAAAPCLVSRPQNGIFSGGLGFAFSMPVSPLWYFGTSLETQLAFVPSHVVTLDPITHQELVDDKEISTIPVLRWSGVFGLDFGWARVFGTIGLRNHPTNTQIRLEPIGVQDGAVEFGPLYALLGLGVEFDLGDYVSILAQVHQPFPLYQDDLIYGFIGGISLDLHAGRQ